MKFEIRNRWTGGVQFTAEIDASDDAPTRLKIGMAVRWAIKSRADLSGADLHGADLRGAVLRRADLSGADLHGADLRGAVLRRADLSDADLSCADLSDAVLRRADLRGADLSGADLRGADLSDAVLRRADLSDAVLRRADLSDAVLRRADLRGADWIPKIPEIHTAVYAAASQDGALDMGIWHRHGFCGTTHCRAGWVTHLAGDAGRVMEGLLGTPAAAALIYQASDPSLERVPDFYASDEDALDDMRRLADAEAAQ